MNKKQAWLHALRLRTLPLSLSGIIMGSGLALYKGFFDTNIFVLALITTVLFQILSNLANDYGDSQKGTDNIHRIGPVRSVQSGVISLKEMKTAILLTSILALISATLLIYFGAKSLSSEVVIFYSILAIACVVAAITYTVGKRAYGYAGLGDIMVFLFFGPVSVMGVYSLFSKDLDLATITPSVVFGLLSVAVLNLNNMRDIKNDAQSGKKTIVVKIGSDFAKFYHVIILFASLAFFIITMQLWEAKFLFIGLIPFSVILFHAYKTMKIKNPKDFDPYLKIVALTTFGIAIFSFLGLYLSI